MQYLRLGYREADRRTTAVSCAEIRQLRSTVPCKRPKRASGKWGFIECVCLSSSSWLFLCARGYVRASSRRASQAASEGLRAAPAFSTLDQSDRVASRSEAMCLRLALGAPPRKFMSAISSPPPRAAKGQQNGKHLWQRVLRNYARCRFVTIEQFIPQRKGTKLAEPGRTRTKPQAWITWPQMTRSSSLATDPSHDA